MKKTIVFLTLLCPALGFAQIHETFKHRDSLNHSWFGDTAHFLPDSGKLQLQGPQSSSTLYYSTTNTLCDSTEWNFEILLGFNPSSTNFVRVYLMSDSTNLKGALNGYFIQLGQSGGKNNIQFFRQEKTSATPVFSGISVFSSSRGLSVQLRIKRTENAEWSVFSNVSGEKSFISEGEPFVDSTFRETAAFGFYCKYSTSSRYNLYTFGEVNIDTIRPDLIPEPPEPPVIPEIPVVIEDADIIISEIMFEPVANAPEYLELFNRSKQFLNVSDLRLGTFNAQDEFSKSLVISKNPEIIIPPKTYILLSKNTETLQTLHSVCADATLVEMPNFPALSNTSGHLVLQRKDSSIIDEVAYHKSMHYALLAETKGVSLERVNFETSGMDAKNWISAAKTSGYATPGCPNSQGVSTIETDELLQLSPSLISPDNDGVDDVLSLAYSLETSGFTGNIRIFNSAGRMVKHLVKSELLSTQGTYYWDGLSEQNSKLPSGIYVVVFDVFSLDGRVVRVKKPIAYR